jgi:hypothetical protein
VEVVAGETHREHEEMKKREKKGREKNERKVKKEAKKDRDIRVTNLVGRIGFDAAVDTVSLLLCWGCRRLGRRVTFY